MWDSFDSIWREASSHPFNQVYTIPLPYMEAGEEGWSIDQGYPEDVQLTAFQEGLIASLRPDIIFTHNPYDEYNILTKTHPESHSFALKASGATVVYVPYYLPGAELPPGHDDLPSYQNFDLIALATERQCAGIAPAHRDSAKALGSPKLDRIVAPTHGGRAAPSLAVPAKRTPILLNTTVAEALEDPLATFKRVLTTFKQAERQPGILIIWRPHPLIRPTLAIKGDAALSLFDRIMHIAEASANVLVDTSPDSLAALSESAAYIGRGGSSLTNAFACTGNPLFLFSVFEGASCEPAGAAWPWIATACPRSTSTLWYTHIHADGLFTLDLTDGTTTLAGWLSQEPRRICGHLALAATTTHVVCAPGSADDFHIFDTSAQHLARIPWPGSQGVSFLRGLTWREQVVFTPGADASVVAVDPEQVRAKVVATLDPAQTGASAASPINCAGAALIEGDTLLLGLAQRPVMCRVNLFSGNVTYNAIPGTHTGVAGMCRHGDWLWFAPSGPGALTGWNERSGETSNIPLPDDQLGSPMIVQSIVGLGDGFLVRGRSPGQDFYVTPDTGELTPIHLPSAGVLPASETPPAASHTLFCGALDDQVILTQNSNSPGIHLLTAQGIGEIATSRSTEIEALDSLCPPFTQQVGIVTPAVFEDGCYGTLEAFFRYVGAGAPGRDRTSFITEASQSCGRLDGQAGRAIYLSAVEARGRKAREPIGEV